MASYLAKRLLLILPTLFGILVINFVIVQFAPGGPVDQVLAQAAGLGASSTSAISSGSATGSTGTTTSGLDPALVERAAALLREHQLIEWPFEGRSSTP